MTAITGAISQLMTFAGNMLTAITENDVLTLFLAVPIVGSAIAIVRRLIHVGR